MIFKTFDSDSEKIISKIGILGRSFEQIGTSIRQRKIEIDNLMGAMSKKDAKTEVGGFWSYIFGNKSIKEQPIDLSKFIDLDNFKASNLLKSLQEIEIASKTNTSAWQEYFSTLSDGQKWQIDFVKNNDLQKSSTEDLIKANQQARASALAHNEAIKAQTFSAKAGKVALQALAMAGNMIAMWGISQAISGLYELSQVSKTVANNAKELGESFKGTSSDIDDYKSEIEELYSTINDSGSSIEDVTNARKSLLSIQDELIDKFGTEKSVIEDVTDAINGQADALDRLTNTKWQEAKNEFNNGGFWNDVSNSLGGYSNNIDRMIAEYGDYKARIRLNDFIDFDNVDQLDEFKELLEKSFDAEITFDISDGNSEIATLSGNASEVYEKLLDIQNLADQFHFNDSFENRLTKLTNSAQEVSDQYKEFYDQYILYEKILNKDSNYTDTFKNITDAYEKYQKAFTSGDEEKIRTATEEYAKILTNATSTAIANSDSDVASYFENMYPTLESVVDGWKFNVAFDANTDDLQNRVQSVLNKLKDENGRSLTTEEILGLNAENAQYKALISIAHSYNMTLEEMIELLKERNLVSEMDYQGLVGLFGQNDIDKLSPEDLEIAYTIKNVGSMTFDDLQAEIQRIKNSTNETEISITPTLSSSVEQIARQLEPQFAKLGEAYKEIFKIDEETGKSLFSLDDVDNSMLEDLRTTFAEIEEEVGVAFDASVLNPFFDTLTNKSSTVEQVQDAFNNLATAYFYSTETLEHLTSETADAIEKQLEEMGVQNAAEVVAEALTAKTEELIVAKEYLAQTGHEIASASDDEINAFILEQIAAGNCGEALALLQLKKLLVNGTLLDTNADINNILSLAQAAGVATDALTMLINLKASFDTAMASGNFIGAASIATQMTAYQTAFENEVANFKPVELDFNSVGGGTSKASKAGKKAGDAYIDSFEEELKELQDLRDRGIIDEKEYLDRLRALYQKYFKDKKKYADQYAKYEREYLEGKHTCPLLQ